jgi:outer membrane protein assembly factor BamA
VSVNSVLVHGVQRTTASLVESLITPLTHAATLNDLADRMDIFHRTVSQLDVFKSVEVTLNKGTSSDTTSVPVDVVVRVKEKKFRLNTGTEWRQNEVTMNAGGTLFNLFGRGEKLEGKLAVGAETQSPFSITLSKPLSHDPSRSSVHPSTRTFTVCSVPGLTRRAPPV